MKKYVLAFTAALMAASLTACGGSAAETTAAKTEAKAEDTSRQRGKASAVAVKATISGILRGLIRDGYPVTKGFKIADIDPRESEYENCFTISDKARCIAGGVLEALLHAGILPE